MSVDISELLREHPVLDGHNDLLWAAREKVGYDFDRLELTDTETCRRLGTQTDLPRLRAGGVGAQFWSVFVPADAARRRGRHRDPRADRRRPRHDRAVRRPAGASPPRSRTSSGHGQQGRIASLMGAEGGHQIDESLGTLRMLHRLGVRYLTLTHNENVPWADSATDAPALGGLSRLRPRGRRRDEPHRDAGRPQPRERRRDAPGARRLAACRWCSPTPRPERSATTRATCPTTCWPGSPATAGSAW